MMARILLVDDDPRVIQALQRIFRHQQLESYSATSAKEALGVLEKQSIDVVISDEAMPGMSGTELLAIVREKYPHTIRMLLTGHASLETATRAINEGHIARFLTKPCNPHELALTIQQALEQRRLLLENTRLMKALKSQSELLEHLETEHPGITDLERDDSGAIVIDEEGLGMSGSDAA